MLTLLPWHRNYWSYIARARRADRLPHALLLQGAPGTGTYEFASFLGGSLLCKEPDENFFPCRKCKSCHLYEAGNHTDMVIIQPEEDSKQIKVDQIRKLIEFISLKSQFERYKVIIVNPADAMNRSAVNTLLKTLEEPPPLSMLLLVTQRPELLPVTIRSRCQQIRFRPDFPQVTRSWLSERISDTSLLDELLVLSNGAPLAALEMYQNGTIEKQKKLLAAMENPGAAGEDPVWIARQWNEMGAEQVMRSVLQLIVDMIKIISNNGSDHNHRTEIQGRLWQLTNRLELYKLIDSYDLLLRNYRLCAGQISYDTQGLLEEFMIHWQRQFQRSGG
ncbi:MAG: DNA polymerase III subunit delta' [Gammaproteobacteria bacterium]